MKRGEPNLKVALLLDFASTDDEMEFVEDSTWNPSGHELLGKIPVTP